MTDYNSKLEVTNCLAVNNMRYIGTDNAMKSDDIKQKYIDGYSDICVFLSTPATFQTTLATVSSKLWRAYILDQSQSNKFTRALSVIAPRYGFSVRPNFVPTVAGGKVTSSSPMKYKLTGNDTGLGYFLRNKLFWKDSMEALHGEHSHSLQWLAIAEAGLGTTIPIVDLYSHAGEFVMTGTNENIYLWAWLADSFPQSMHKFGDAKVLKKNNHNLTSNSFRSPQNITSLLVSDQGPTDGHFVSTYLYYRYVKRNWIKGNIGGSIGGIASAKAISSDAWGVSTRQENRYIRSDFNDKTKLKRQGVEYDFHGITGELYNS